MEEKQKKGRVQRDEWKKQIPLVLSVASVLLVLLVTWKVFDESDDFTNQEPYTPIDFSRSLIKQEEGGLSNTGIESQGTVEKKEQDGETNNNEEAKRVVERVGKHFLFPEGNVTVGTVTNAQGLREEQPAIYQYAKNGDKILYYSHGILIYDPGLDRIVDVIRVVRD